MMWCRIIGVGQKRVSFGQTQDGEIVLVPNRNDPIPFEIGDIVQFEASEKVRGTPFNKVRKPAKYFAVDPWIIARKLRRAHTDTRPRPSNSVEWKAEKEAQADADGLREVLSRAGDSFAGMAGTE